MLVALWHSFLSKNGEEFIDAFSLPLEIQECDESVTPLNGEILIISGPLTPCPSILLRPTSPSPLEQCYGVVEIFTSPPEQCYGVVEIFTSPPEQCYGVVEIFTPPL